MVSRSDVNCACRALLSVPCMPASWSIAASLIWQCTTSPSFIMVKRKARRSRSWPMILSRVSGIQLSRSPRTDNAKNLAPCHHGRKTCRGPLINERSPGRLRQRRGQRFVLLAIRPANGGNPAEMIERLLTIALLELPQPIILPGQHVVRIGLQRALVPDLRLLVVAELAIGVADEIGDVRMVVMAERLQLLDRGHIVVTLVDGVVGSAIAGRECRIADAGLVVWLFAFLRCLWAGAFRVSWLRFLVRISARIGIRGADATAATTAASTARGKRRRVQQCYRKCTQRDEPDHLREHLRLLSDPSDPGRPDNPAPAAIFRGVVLTETSALVRQFCCRSGERKTKALLKRDFGEAAEFS